jgi:hypothetical protein
MIDREKRSAGSAAKLQDSPGHRDVIGMQLCERVFEGQNPGAFHPLCFGVHPRDKRSVFFGAEFIGHWRPPQKWLGDPSGTSMNTGIAQPFPALAIENRRGG